MKGTRGVIAASVLIISILLSSVCFGSIFLLKNSRKQYFPEEFQVKNHTGGEIGTFGLNIASADEMGDWVTDWLSDETEGEGFQYLIYADSDSWDVYLYYPEKQAEIQMLTNEEVTVEYSDSTLNVYVTPYHEESTFIDQEEKWILHFSAYPFGAWPSKIELYWDDHEVLCDKATLH